MKDLALFKGLEPVSGDNKRNPQELRITFAPGVIGAILNDRNQSERADRGGYRLALGDMDLGQGEIAAQAAARIGLDCVPTAAYLRFATEEQLLNGIERIHAAEPRRLGWKWRTERDPRPSADMSTEAWVAWMQSQPISEIYYTNTSKDPNRKCVVGAFFDQEGQPYYATADDFADNPGVNKRMELEKIHSAKWQRVMVDGREIIMGYSEQFVKGYIFVDLRPMTSSQRTEARPTDQELVELSLFMGRPQGFGETGLIKS